MRGYEVHLAEAKSELGGRVTAESALPGLGAWGRVRDYRTYQISQMANVSIYRESRMDAATVREFAAAHVVLATGSRWRRDGIGRQNLYPIEGWERDWVLGAGDVMAGAQISGPVVVFDDEDYYLGGVLAEKLSADGHAVSLVTPASEASGLCHHTLEHGRVQARLLALGVTTVANRNIACIGDGEIELANVYSDARESLACATLVMVTARQPDDALYHALVADHAALADAGITTVTRIGDCMAPASIAAAVFEGHRYARELDAPAPADVPFKRERIAL